MAHSFLQTLVVAVGCYLEETDVTTLSVSLYSFAQLTQHPAGWNPIFKPEVKAESLPKGIVKIVKE
ncbi:TPA: bacteriocin immunity protein [Klebsiella variicola]|nr:bacteriocin immunity protein [Klebsiella pneumoniae]HBC8620153.1 bacteriocin immunity protein [Klebsiella oxytoca]HCI5974361.1 bacteriocin immunity protein [Klebsiella quasipneumoniae subsp. similipneumoniae]HCQ8675805.1 bacteriocin immunity protein [Klebsiella variicola]HDE1089973.1 bacteriocin immunity protein [Klebsiella quasipneumoniae]HDX8866217.1 bacteriocin immunity protein [Klebsiella michiganensis]